MIDRLRIAGFKSFGPGGNPGGHLATLEQPHRRYHGNQRHPHRVRAAEHGDSCDASGCTVFLASLLPLLLILFGLRILATPVFGPPGDCLASVAGRAGAAAWRVSWPQPWSIAMERSGPASRQGSPTLEQVASLASPYTAWESREQRWNGWCW